MLGYLNVCNVNNQRSSVISMDCMVSYISLLTIRAVKMASGIQISSFILNKMFICCFFSFTLILFLLSSNKKCMNQTNMYDV